MSSETSPITVAEIFEKVARGIKRHPDKVKEVDSVYLFRISGKEEGVFHVDLKSNPGVRPENKDAECTLDIRDRDFIKLYKGILPGFKAILNGKLKVSGDLLAATRLGILFRAAKED